MTLLKTDRLTLRAAQDDDLGPLFRMFSDPKAMRYWSNLPHKTEAETLPSLEKLKKPGPRTYFVLDHRDTVIGIGGIHTGTEIGFMLHPDHWRQGFAAEAVRAIVDHTWATTDFPKITADVDPLNLSSLRLLTKLGFQVSGFAKDTFCVGKNWSDSVFFALPRPDSL
ncbi:MAG: GNAT family N-acetyltransferase [Paracoccaceae bacterium]